MLSSFWLLQLFKLWEFIHGDYTLCVFICHLSSLEAVLSCNLLILIEVWVVNINDIAQLCFLKTAFNKFINIVLSWFERNLCSGNLRLSDISQRKFSLCQWILNFLRYHQISACLIVAYLISVKGISFYCSSFLLYSTHRSLKLAYLLTSLAHSVCSREDSSKTSILLEQAFCWTESLTDCYLQPNKLSLSFSVRTYIWI